MSKKPKFVYFIRPVGMDGPIKIGCSDTPAKRLAIFAPWAPFPLELIGAVPGGHQDESFLHRAFANLHSHREWFISSPELRAAIKTIIENNSVDAARSFLKAKRTVRKSVRIVRSPEHQRFLDLQTQVAATEKKLRGSLGDNGAFGPPNDVLKIVKGWNAQVYRGTGFDPTEQEMERVSQYLADPIAHSIVPDWRKAWLAREPYKKQPILVPHLVDAPEPERQAS